MLADLRSYLPLALKILGAILVLWLIVRLLIKASERWKEEREKARREMLLEIAKKDLGYTQMNAITFQPGPNGEPPESGKSSMGPAAMAMFVGDTLPDPYLKAPPIPTIKIRTSAGSNHFVKLDAADCGRPLAAVFIRGGQTESVKVPVGPVRVKFASGQTWLGSEELFGSATQFSKADQVLTITETQSFTITLYKVKDGNLSTSPISAEEF